jgi:hypothetical protein
VVVPLSAITPGSRKALSDHGFCGSLSGQMGRSDPAGHHVGQEVTGGIRRAGRRSRHFREMGISYAIV